MVSVAAKHIHVTGSVYDGGVTVTGGWAGALHEAGLLGAIVLLKSLLAFQLGDQLAVDFEALVSVLDNEGVLHAHGGGTVELAFLAAAVRFI